MNSILIYDLAGHRNSPLNTYWMELPWQYSCDCMSMASEAKGWGWQSITDSIGKFLGQREEAADPKKGPPPPNHPLPLIPLPAPLKSLTVYLWKKSGVCGDGLKIGWVFPLTLVQSQLCYLWGVQQAEEEDALLSTTSHCFIKTYFILASRVTWLFISWDGGAL